MTELPPHLKDEFWQTVRGLLGEQGFLPGQIDLGIDNYRTPIIEKGAEDWIYHRDPEQIAETIQSQLISERHVVGRG